MSQLRIEFSYLALRFYKHNGWTKELLNQYLLYGEILNVWKNQEVQDYWFLNHEKNTLLDMDRLVKDLNPRVFNWSTERLLGEQALSYLKEINW